MQQQQQHLPIADIAAELAEVARLIGRLRPDWRDAEACAARRSGGFARSLAYPIARHGRLRNHSSPLCESASSSA
jgi:hypothetical protein